MDGSAAEWLRTVHRKCFRVKCDSEEMVKCGEKEALKSVYKREEKEQQC